MSTKKVTNKTEFWLSNNSGKSTFMFPVLPAKISIKRDNSNESVNVSGLGEITIIQDPSLKQFEFTSHFPATTHQGVQATILKNPKLLKTPQKYVELIEKWIAAKKPVKFTITSPKVSLFCTIESFDYYEQGGDPDTIYYTIKLKEYREATIRKLDKTPTRPTGGGGGGGTGGGGGGGTGGGSTAVGFDYGIVKTKGGRLKMYKSTSTSSKVLAKLSNGTYVKMISKTGKWYKVKTMTKKTGYVNASYIKKATNMPEILKRFFS